MQRREGAFLQALALPSHFWLPLLASHFCPFVSNAFFWQLFIFKQKKQKTIEKKKNVKKGKSFPSSSYFTLSLLAPTFALLLFPFCFKPFFLASSSY